MKGFARVIAVTALTAIGTAGLSAPMAMAQQRGDNASGEAVANMPPALKAAVLSGNPDAIKQAIATLSGSDSSRAATLADQVVRAAEQLFTVNPKGAIQIAQVAVSTIQATQVQQAAPQQTQNVITTAARLFINPAAQTAAPDATAQLAMATVQAASTTNNAALAASTAGQAVGLAQNMLSSNAATAIQIVGVAVQLIKQDSVVNGAATQAMEVAVAAARVIVRPEAQGVANSDAVNIIKTSLYTMISTDTAATKSPDQSRTTKEILAGNLPQQQKTADTNNSNQNNNNNSPITEQNTKSTASGS